jgi:hypothetical protein
VQQVFEKFLHSSRNAKVIANTSPYKRARKVIQIISSPLPQALTPPILLSPTRLFAQLRVQKRKPPLARTAQATAISHFRNSHRIISHSATVPNPVYPVNPVSIILSCSSFPSCHPV